MLGTQASSLDERVELLRFPGVFAGLPEACLRDVAAVLRPARFAKGDVIIAREMPGAALHLLTSGLVEVRVRSEGGAFVPVAGFRPGDTFGEMSLLSGEPTSADVIAVQDSETLALDRSTFEELTRAHPELLWDFLRLLSRRLRETDSVVGVTRDMSDVVARMLAQDDAESYGDLIGNHKDVHELRKQIDALAASDEPVLIEGEAGTGKELVARTIHKKGPRRELPIVVVVGKRVSTSTDGDTLFGESRVVRGNVQAPSYFQVASGGTLLIKGVEDLPAAVQERLAVALANGGAIDGVRIVATCRTPLSALAVAGGISPALAATLARQVVRTPPLRERKRDIGALAEHFVRRHAGRLGKVVTGLDDQALIKLVSYDFRIGNVRELEEAIERAVVLRDGETIDAEEIFLGPPPRVASGGLNLAGLVAPLLRLGPRVFPEGIAAIVAVGLAGVLILCFTRRADAAGLATTLVWSLFWPALVLSFFFVGRVCCAVCPMAFAGSMVQLLKRREGRIPGWVKRYDSWIVLAGFLVVVWAEEVTSMRTSPPATGILLLAILVLAVLCAILFPRRTWCRHLCPLGGLAGVCSASSMLELRPTLDVCSAKCRDHSCYKGEGNIPGCPMFNHVMFLESNQPCVFCLNCVRSCPSGSPHLNLRIPARELWTSLTARPEVGRFVAMLAGLVVAVTLVHAWEQDTAGGMRQLLEMDRMALVSGLLLCSTGTPLLLLALAARRATRRGGSAAGVWHRVAAWVPLVAAGFTAYHVAFLPGIDTLRATLSYQPDSVFHSMSVHVAALLQGAIITAGLVLTLVAIWKDRERGPEGRSRFGRLAGAAGYWFILLLLIVRPSWLPW